MKLTIKIPLEGTLLALFQNKYVKLESHIDLIYMQLYELQIFFLLMYCIVDIYPFLYLLYFFFSFNKFKLFTVFSDLEFF